MDHRCEIGLSSVRSVAVFVFPADRCVPPLQGLCVGVVRVPRALPWASMLGPFGAFLVRESRHF